MDVLPRLQRLLDGEPASDDLTRVRYALALQLAAKLDEAVADQSTGSAQATPGISKELRAVLDTISASMSNKKGVIASVFDE